MSSRTLLLPCRSISVRRAMRGVSLVELMIAMAISLLLTAGALTLFASTTNNYLAHQSGSTLQESARYVFSVLEPDIRLAGYWGLTGSASTVSGGSSQLVGTPASTLGAPASAVGACGLNFGVDVQTPLEGTAAGYLAGAGPGSAPQTAAMPSAGTITVRHASVAASVTTGNGPLRVCSTFSAAVLVNTLANCIIESIVGPTGAVTNGGIYDLVVNTYYVDQNSPTTAGVPTLYRQTLTNTNGAAPTMVNTPILPGVEDLEIQFGIDPSGASGTASQYVDAQTALQLYNGSSTATVQVVAVRVWLLLRSLTPSGGFTDTNTYQYGDRSIANGTVATLTGASAGKAYAPKDHFLRLLVSRTIMLRNAAGT